jgi:hypothetical protein
MIEHDPLLQLESSFVTCEEMGQKLCLAGTWLFSYYIVASSG